MANKETTNEELAQMVARGFGNVDKRFEQVDSRLDGIDDRLEGIDERLDRIENLLIRDNINRIERLEDSMLRVKTKLEME